jgi:photosystem II stability/assembly factor-like uncharacterized protein
MFFKKNGTFNFIPTLLTFLLFIQLSCESNAVSPINTGNYSWTYLGLGNETFSALGLDPTDLNIIYVGSRYNFSDGTPGRLFKSTDGGKSWDTLIVDYGAIFLGIVVSPQNNAIVYAAPWGIIKSQDGGKTWQEQDNGIITFPGETHVATLVMDPVNSNILYAGTGGLSGGKMYKTTNGGVSWNIIGKDSVVNGIISIAITPTNSNIIYAGTAGNGILWKSTDSGESWKRTGLGETDEIIYSLYIDLIKPNIIFSGMTYIRGAPLSGIWKSTDGGEEWASFNQGLPDSSSVMYIIESSFGLNIYSAVESRIQGKTGIYARKAAGDTWTQIGADSIGVCLK